MRPTKTCPSCQGIGKVRLRLEVPEGEPYPEKDFVMDTCGVCLGKGSVSVSDSELLDMIWERVKGEEWDPR